MLIANTGNTPVNSNVHIHLLPKSANPPEMALKSTQDKFSCQVGLSSKTWDSILSYQNFDFRKARPEISKDIFGLAAFLLPWPYLPSPCQNTRRVPPVNRGSKNPQFLWGLNASEGGRNDPFMRCKNATSQENFIRYCKSQIIGLSDLNTYNPTPVMRRLNSAAREQSGRSPVLFIIRDGICTPLWVDPDQSPLARTRLIHTLVTSRIFLRLLGYNLAFSNLREEISICL